VEFEVQVAHSVREVGQEAWDRLAGNRPFASYRWYRFGEAVLTDNTPIYIILLHRGEPIARGTFWLREREQLPISSQVVRYLIEALLHRWPLLVCRVPLADTHGLILPEEPSLHTAALRAVVRAAQEQAQQHRASFLIFDYLREEQTRYACWPGVFTAIRFSDPGTYLAIAWADFDGYLNHLSRKRRKHYRQDYRHASELGMEITLQSTVKDIDRAVALTRNVERKHHSSPYPWTKELLENAAMVNAAWVAATVKDRLVGGELVMDDAGVCCVKALGLDYSVPYVYFMLGYTDIRYAIEKGAHILRWGSGAYDTKRRLGFQLEDNNYALVAAESLWLQWLGRWVAQMETEQPPDEAQGSFA
jgi:predicted N-acyltransferase